MNPVTQEYIDSLPEIYGDILKAFVMFHPLKRLESGVALQSLYSLLFDKHPSSKVRIACERMQEAGVLDIDENNWLHPTKLGTELIERLTEGKRPEDQVPDFPPIEQSPG